jgi:hypothetical protein
MRYGRPAVFGEILVGFLLGPTAIALLRLWPLLQSNSASPQIHLKKAPERFKKLDSKKIAGLLCLPQLLPKSSQSLF